MSKNERTDPHRPSALDPADYVFVGAADDHPGASWINISYDRLREHGVELEGEGVQSVPFYNALPDGRPNYRCHHCGKHGSGIHYFCFFLHKPSKEVIVVGQICAKKANLASKEELDFQKSDAYRKQSKLRNWLKGHQTEYDYLREYSEIDWYSEFFDSLWTKLQEYGSLTERQVAGLNRWMEKGKPWERVQLPYPNQEFDREGHVVDGDRHKGEVTRTQEPPTEPQIKLINDLAKELEGLMPTPLTWPSGCSWETRIEASNLINELKAQLAAQRERQNQATESQKSFINRLMDERKMDIDKRQEARSQFDAGLTKTQASRWIEKLLTLPRVEE